MHALVCYTYLQLEKRLGCHRCEEHRNNYQNAILEIQKLQEKVKGLEKEIKELEDEMM